MVAPTQSEDALNNSGTFQRDADVSWHTIGKVDDLALELISSAGNIVSGRIIFNVDGGNAPPNRRRRSHVL